MKATISKDGQMRLTLRVVHRVDADDIIDALGWKLMRDVDFSECDNKAMRVEAELKLYKSRAALLKVTMESLHDEGSAVWVWSDDGDDKVIHAIREQGRVLVHKKFPELKPQPAKAV